jgi:hypothetical protein
MLRDEDNANYRLVMKNTIEFDPQVLKRYVNFMNNPDEKSAAEQFGTLDKYFGVCTLMVTLPGLPMFGHGQIEGYREKYGMEYRYAKWNEFTDEGLVRGHEWRIFPLTHRRYIFAEVDNFLLYDFYTPEGNVNEDVFAYSNRTGDPDNAQGRDRGLVVYQNKYAETRGWLKTSAAYMHKASGNLVQKTLSDGLGLPGEGYALFKDYVSGLEYIRSCQELIGKGLFVSLGGYQCHVFMDWRFVVGEQWKAVCETLNGAGVQSIQARYAEMFMVKKEPGSEMVVKKKRGSRRKPSGKNAQESVIVKPVKRVSRKSAPRKKVIPKS